MDPALGKPAHGSRRGRTLGSVHAGPGQPGTELGSVEAWVPSESPGPRHVLHLAGLEWRPGRGICFHGDASTGAGSWAGGQRG